MIGNDFTKEEILKFARFLGFGFYRVTKDGKFVECDSTARRIFKIPPGQTDLSKYSISKFYVASTEREWRISRLAENKSEPLCSTLSVRVKGENLLLFDMCWYDDGYQDSGNFVGLVSKIEESTLFPKMFDTFPMGLYEVDDDNNVVRVNKKFVEIFKYKSADEIIGENIKNLYEDKKDAELFSRVIKEQGFAHDILRAKDAKNRIIELESFSQRIHEFGDARWGMINDVTERERYFRSLDRLPTGFYHVEQEHITQCNDQFAQILGFERKEDAIGVNLTEVFHPDKEASKKLFEDLYEADKKGKPLSNYIFETIRINDKKTIYISVDVHLVKNHRGKVIGREGTIRDVSEEIELRDRVKETEERLQKTTADINKLIHTFLHPVVKFAGNSELLHRVSNFLHQTIQPETPQIPGHEELGEKLMTKLNEVRDKLPDETPDKHDDLDFLVANDFKKSLTNKINTFDYSLKTEKSKILIESTIKDMALWVFEELNRIKYSENSKIKPLIKKDFIEFLQGILFNHSIRGAKILMAEAEIMRREVDALRAYIGLQKERKISFMESDIGTILEENIERFKPILLEKEIEIEYKPSGNLKAEISPNDIDRVICNLFYNAKKYSYGGKGRFVRVEAKELTHEKKVEFSIQSFGIAIKREEIESGYIFKFGNRGELAFKSDRDGTGVGLTDAKDVIEAHSGELILTSIPAGNESDPPGYKVPYLTKVEIKIPKTQVKKE